ncbi:efflux RND transporter periplasmic adaptor subunit [Albidovulum aquaemixtae]|uniref:efflux RND transporter periplasmic adaptor subunit n=1 Tax=Albidovulum aquaemixtae TaxID=1542388 RepID=UPI001FE4A9B2|nr:efflux RND transporter periplasmic adaptor subunit [Defluviimonas aquaemixtae]
MSARVVIGRVPFSGTLVPVQEVLVFPQVSGFAIDQLNFDIGDAVDKGDILANLNKRSLEAQLAQADAELARALAAVSQARSQITSAEASAVQARAGLDRSERLMTSGNITQSSLDQAVATAQTAEAALSSAKDGLAVAEAQLQQVQAQRDIAALNFDHATIRAPASGIVSARNGQIGAIATSGGEPIFRLIADADIEVEAEIIETALGQINVDDRVTLDIAGIGASVGAVRRIAPVVDTRSRLGTVRITPEATSGLRPGLFTSGWIVTEEREALTVPAAAVLADRDGTFVLVVEDGVIEKRPVTAGLIWDGRREIVSGVTGSEFVVARAGAFFSDGDSVDPVLSETADEGSGQ